MAQFSRPISDISNPDGWSPTPVWQQIDEVIASDVDEVTVSVAFTTATFVCGMSVVTDPVSSSGHILRVRGFDDAFIPVSIELLQGPATVITLFQFQSTTRANFTYTLSGAEADAITDYSILRIRVTGGDGTNTESAGIEWVEFEVPDSGPPPNPPVGTKGQFDTDLILLNWF